MSGYSRKGHPVTITAQCKFCGKRIRNQSNWPEDQWMHAAGGLRYCRRNGEINQEEFATPAPGTEGF